jgi:hypothetical protein
MKQCWTNKKNKNSFEKKLQLKNKLFYLYPALCIWWIFSSSSEKLRPKSKHLKHPSYTEHKKAALVTLLLIMTRYLKKLLEGFSQLSDFIEESWDLTLDFLHKKTAKNCDNHKLFLGLSIKISARDTNPLRVKGKRHWPGWTRGYWRAWDQRGPVSPPHHYYISTQNSSVPDPKPYR